MAEGVRRRWTPGCREKSRRWPLGRTGGVDAAAAGRDFFWPVRVLGVRRATDRMEVPASDDANAAVAGVDGSAYPQDGVDIHRTSVCD